MAWAHVAINLKLLTQDWAGSLDGWVREGMLTGGPRDFSIFYELHSATLRLDDSLAYEKEKSKLRKGGESSGKTRPAAGNQTAIASSERSIGAKLHMT